MKKNDDYIKRAAAVVPSKRQLKWHELEFYAFIHFGMNTFTNSEWGNGNDDPVLFNPEKLNANQWAAAVRAAGMKAIILTCKHHDGFCLWPSEYTDYSVKKSKWKDGQGDVVRECAEACKKFGLKFGVYLSPWDRHDPRYGEGEAYNKYFKNQLRELLTNYGDIFCVWFDGACGEGKNGRKQEYDWQGYYDLIRECQPEAVISVTGPDVRWCGNEAGVCRKSEWNVVPYYYSNQELIAAASQQTAEKPPKRISATTLDLGSRTIHALVSQTGYTGEYGFEIYCKAQDTVDLWKALLKAGEPEGLIPCGLGARDTLRLEASMPLYGHEMNDEITPKMAGLPCKLTGKDFIGRDVLVALGAPKMKRIGMKVVGRGIVREHCDLYTMDGEKIGWASSGTFAPYIGCGVAMGYIPVEDIEIGKHLNADVRGRMVELEIVPMPFYKLER